MVYSLFAGTKIPPRRRASTTATCRRWTRRRRRGRSVSSRYWRRRRTGSSAGGAPSRGGPRPGGRRDTTRDAAKLWITTTTLDVISIYCLCHPLSCEILLSIFDMFRRPVCSPIGNLNFPSKTKQNITTEEMTHIVLWSLYFSLRGCVKIAPATRVQPLVDKFGLQSIKIRNDEVKLAEPTRTVSKPDDADTSARSVGSLSLSLSRLELSGEKRMREIWWTWWWWIKSGIIILIISAFFCRILCFGFRLQIQTIQSDFHLVGKLLGLILTTFLEACAKGTMNCRGHARIIRGLQLMFTKYTHA